MADDPPQPGPTNPAAGRARPADLIQDAATISQRDRPVAITLFQTFVDFLGPSRGGRRVSDEVLDKALAYGHDREARDDRLRRLLINWAGFLTVMALSTVVIVVALLRDRTELVKVIFEGVALLVTHGVVGTGGYVIGKGRRRTRRR